MVESFDDELLDNNEWDIKKEILWLRNI
jgi:hypothetical protein